jgi:tetratricopeptide (TPR) repeat protein
MSQPEAETIEQRAASLAGLLRSLQGEVEFGLNPDRLALQTLGIDRTGWVPRPYGPEAVDIWERLLTRSPDDPMALHHLAIAHHAQAIDLEMAGCLEQADGEWDVALRLWRRLYKHDGFWDYLTEHTRKDAALRVREKLPELLMQIHFDLAFLPGQTVHRAQFHIRMAMGMPFPLAAKAAVRRETYTRFIRSVPDVVWQVDMRDPTIVKQGNDAILRYLDLDPGCRPALEDALRLQVRLLEGRCQEFHAVEGNSPERHGVLQQLQGDAEQWKPYFDQLTKEAGELEHGVREHLCTWYRLMGDVLSALEQYEPALAYYEQGSRAGLEDDEQTKRCRRAIGNTLALLAREQARCQSPGAREACERVRSRGGLSVEAHCILVGAYLSMGELDVAEEVCRAGLATSSEAVEFAALESDHQHAEQLTEALQTTIPELRARRTRQQGLAEAQDRMTRNEYAEALSILDRLVDLPQHDPQVHVNRGRCLLELNAPERAIAELEIARGLRPRGPDADAFTEELEQLEARARALAESMDTFGAETMKLRQQAANAFALRRYEVADRHYREAIRFCRSSKGQALLREELSRLLAEWAVTNVNRYARDHNLAAGECPEVLTDALAKLEEAAQVNPRNGEAAALRQRLLEMMRSSGPPAAGGRDPKER